MSRPFRISFGLSVLLFALAAIAPLGAQDTSFRNDLLADLDELQEKIVGLAEAIPADKYSWAPGEGVRTVSQAIMHTAAANYFFPTVLGQGMPEGVNPRGFEQITDKAKIVETTKASFAHLRSAIASTPDEKLHSTMTAFGQQVTGAGFLHNAVSHNHEHLGQLIAYARSVGVTPPWSE